MSLPPDQPTPAPPGWRDLVFNPLGIALVLVSAFVAPIVLVAGVLRLAGPVRPPPPLLPRVSLSVPYPPHVAALPVLLPPPQVAGPASVPSPQLLVVVPLTVAVASQLPPLPAPVAMPVSTRPARCHELTVEAQLVTIEPNLAAALRRACR